MRKSGLFASASRTRSFSTGSLNVASQLSWTGSADAFALAFQGWSKLTFDVASLRISSGGGGVAVQPAAQTRTTATAPARGETTRCMRPTAFLFSVQLEDQP